MIFAAGLAEQKSGKCDRGLMPGRVLFFGVPVHLETKCVRINSTFSVACSVGTHDFCAREMESRGQDRVCGCPCDDDKQPPPSSDLMGFVHAIPRVFLALSRTHRAGLGFRLRAPFLWISAMPTGAES